MRNSLSFNIVAFLAVLLVGGCFLGGQATFAATNGVKKITVVGVPQKLQSVTNNYIKTRQRRSYNLRYLQGVRSGLESIYSKLGYFLVRVAIPQQNLNSNRSIRFMFVDGRIANIRQVVRKDSSVNRQINVAVANVLQKELARKPLLTQKKVSQALYVVNNIPGTSARTVLSKSNVPGAADLNVLTKFSKLSNVFLLATNRTNKSVNNVTFNGGLSVNNVFSTDSLALSFTKGLPFRNLNGVSATYTYDMLPSGSSLALGLSYSVNQPKRKVSASAKGTFKKFSITYTQPISKDFTNNTDLAVSFYALRSNSYLFNFETNAYVDSIRALSLAYNFSQRFKSNNTSIGSISITQGIPFGIKNKETTPSRASGRGRFTKLNYNYAYTIYLADSYNVAFSSQGQWASRIVYSAEEIDFGGALFGGAYDSGQLAGNKGIMGKVALKKILPYNENLYYVPYVYYDLGKVFGVSAASAASFGVGVTVFQTGGLNMDFQIAKPLTHTAGDKSNDRKVRLFFSIGANF